MNSMLAYFDPSAGSLLLQALVGGFGGFVVAGRYLWIQLLGNRLSNAAVPQAANTGMSAQNHTV